MERMTRVSIIQGFLMIAIFTMLTMYGFKYTAKQKEYTVLEDKLYKAAEKYIDKKIKFDDVNKELKITLEDLKKEKVIDNLDLKKESCTGYILVTKEEFKLIHSSYIKCKRYKTEEY